MVKGTTYVLCNYSRVPNFTLPNFSEDFHGEYSEESLAEEESFTVRGVVFWNFHSPAALCTILKMLHL